MVAQSDRPTLAEPDLLTVAMVAHKASVSVPTIWRLRAAGNLPAPVKVGHSIRWRRVDVDAWIAAGCNGDGTQPDSTMAPVNRRKRAAGLQLAAVEPMAEYRGNASTN